MLENLTIMLSKAKTSVAGVMWWFLRAQGKIQMEKNSRAIKAISIDIKTVLAQGHGNFYD